MAEVVRQRDGFGQVFVEPQGAGEGAGDLGDFQGVGQPRPVMVLFGVNEDLRLVLEPPKGLGVQDPVPVALELGADGVRRFGPGPSLRLGGLVA